MKGLIARPGPAPLAAACAALLLLCAAAPPAPTAKPATRPAVGPAVATTQPAAAPSTQPARAPTPAAVRSEIGQAAIRRDAPRDNSARTTPAESQPTSPGFDLPKVAGALALVLALIFVLRGLLRRSMAGAGLPGATNAVQVLTRSPVSPRQQVLLVRVGRRLLVVGDCNGQLNALSEISDPDEVAALIGQLRDEKLTAASSSFGNVLGRWRRAAGDGDEADEGEAFPRAAPDVPQRRRGDDAAADADDDPAVASTRGEIQGLMERVRLLSNQFRAND